MKIVDITGSRFGSLLVVSKSARKTPGNSNSQWECLCDCGASTTVDLQNLKKGRTKSCGCGRPNLGIAPGQIFGRLTVEKKAEDGGGYWIVSCECGNSSRVAGANLVKGSSTSCGCRRKEVTKSVKKTHGLSKKPRWVMLCNARQRAKAKGLPFSLTLSDIPEIPDKCPLLGIDIIAGASIANDRSPSLDRIIPELGYVPGNIQIISRRANTIKNNSLFYEFEAIYLAWRRQQEIGSTTPSSSFSA